MLVEAFASIHNSTAENTNTELAIAQSQALSSFLTQEEKTGETWPLTSACDTSVYTNFMNCFTWYYTVVVMVFVTAHGVNV